MCHENYFNNIINNKESNNKSNTKYPQTKINYNNTLKVAIICHFFIFFIYDMITINKNINYNIMNLVVVSNFSFNLRYITIGRQRIIIL